MLCSKNSRLNDQQKRVCDMLDEYGVSYEIEELKFGTSDGDVIRVSLDAGDVIIHSNLKLQADPESKYRDIRQDAATVFGQAHRGFNPRLRKGKLGGKLAWYLHID